MFQEKAKILSFRLLYNLLFISCVFITINSCKTTSKAPKVAANEIKNFKYYKVKKGDSISNIAKKYKISEDELRLLNQGLKGEIRVGQNIKVPLISVVEKKVPVKEKPKTDEVPVVKKPVFQMGLVLPFTLSKNTDIEDIDYDAKSALEFYEGCLIACDSLEKKGLKLKLHVYDTENDSMKIRKIFNYPEIGKLNLMISPLISDFAKQTVKLAKEKQVKMLVPFSNNAELISSNEFVYLSTPTVNTQCTQMGSYLKEKFSKSNIIIIHNNKPKEKELSDVFRKSLVSDARPGVKIFNYSSAGLKTITDNLVKGGDNIIVIPSSDQAFVVQILTLLKNHEYPGKISVCGLPTWKKFDVIDPETLEYFKVMIFDDHFIDFNNEKINQFRLEFIKRYNAEPTHFSYAAYDIINFLGTMMLKNGKKFLDEVPKESYHGLHTDFSFHSKGTGAGNENKNVVIMQFKNFQLLKLN